MKLFFAITLSAITTFAWATDSLDQNSALSSTVTNSTYTAPSRETEGCVPPAYPQNSIKNHEEGKTTIALLIGTDHRVKEGKIIESSGYSDLDNATLNAFKPCHFTPATKDGIAVEGWYKMRWAWNFADD